ncbi:MAG: hypothetical protein M1281_00940 [Chloroflexi bacterium]|nr:hypothetical protein [Chloroflexota bacterium]
MTSRLLELSDRMCRLLLKTYPAEFRERYAAEMAQVFRSLHRETYRRSRVGGLLGMWLSALCDLAVAIVHQWWVSLARERKGFMQSHATTHRDQIESLSPLQAVIAALPFIVFGISSMATRVSFLSPGTSPSSLWQALFLGPYPIFSWLILIGLGAGFLLDFPRWAYIYLGWGLLSAGWWSNWQFSTYSIKGLYWLPILGVILIALLIRRSLQPLRRLFAGIWHDWTLPSLALYIFYGQIFLLYDENHHPYLLPFIALTALATALGAWGYFRASTPLRRILALLAGLFLATLLSTTSYATWDYQAYYGLPEGSHNDILVGVLFFGAIGLVMFGNGWLARWRLSRRSRTKET